MAREKWKEKRLKWLQNCRINSDIDIFDLCIRLPAADILYHCAFFRVGDEYVGKQQRKRRMLKIQTRENPAIFMERNVTLSHPIEGFEVQQQATTFQTVSIQSTDNLRFLERYFGRQGVFRFHSDLSHTVGKGGMLCAPSHMSSTDSRDVFHINL